MSESKQTSIIEDLGKIPCFKKTFQVSTGSGIVAGLASFLFTSRVKRSADIAVGTFAVTTIIHWIYCRYEYTNRYFESEKMRTAMRRAALKRETLETETSN